MFQLFNSLQRLVITKGKVSMCRKEVERANTVSTFWSLDYEETTLGV